MTVANPLRPLGVARILSGAWFIATGVGTLRQYRDFLPQAQRLFETDSGTTGAPIRSLLTLLAAVVLIVLGLMLIARGLGWLGRLPLPSAGPAPLAPGEVTATLRDHRLLACDDHPASLPWPLGSWLGDELAEMTWWRREITARAVRTFAIACGGVVLLSTACLALPRLLPDDLVGPFPLGFVIMLPFVTAIWAALGLMLIGSDGLRIESEQLALPAGGGAGEMSQVIESPPVRLEQASPWLALTLGLAGVGVQCLMPSWLEFSPIDYPVRATALIRHAGTIGASVLFFLIGGRMIAAAASVLQLFRYESMLLLLDGEGATRVVRAAAVRSESLGLAGERHLVAAVGGAHTRESVAELVREFGSAPDGAVDRRGDYPSA